MAGADPLEPAGVGVGQAAAGAAGVAAGGDGQRGQLGALQPVPHPVEHRDPGAAGVDGVVDGVASDLVGPFEGAGNRDLVAGERQRG